MIRKRIPTIVCVIILTMLLSSCKLPASTAPEIPDEELMTTPILIVTDSLGMATQAPEEKAPGEETQEPGEDFFAEPTSTPLPTVVVPTVTRPAEYTLMPGEFPFCIARRFNLDPQQLLSLNNLGPNDLLDPGTVLQIPQTGTWVGEGRVRNPHPTTHTVSAGESVYSIACFYGDVSPEAIIAVNGLEEPFNLTPGQTLSIP
jgi:LysM repeat protein